MISSVVTGASAEGTLFLGLDFFMMGGGLLFFGGGGAASLILGITWMGSNAFLVSTFGFFLLFLLNDLRQCWNVDRG